MKDEDKTKQQLINELEEMRRRLAQLLPAGSERSQAKETLNQSVKHFQTLMETAPVVICRIDLKTKVVYANKK